MPFDPNVIEAYKKMKSMKTADGLQIDPISPEDQLQTVDLKDAPYKDFDLPNASPLSQDMVDLSLNQGKVPQMMSGPINPDLLNKDDSKTINYDAIQKPSQSLSEYASNLFNRPTGYDNSNKNIELPLIPGKQDPRSVGIGPDNEPISVNEKPIGSPENSKQPIKINEKENSENDSSEDDSKDSSVQSKSSPYLKNNFSEDANKLFDFSGNTLNTVEALQKAQDERKNQQTLAMLARGLNTLNAGIMNKQSPTLNAVGPSEELETQIKGLEKRADESLADFQARAAKEKDDPNSSYSKGMRDFLKKNYNVDAKNASASQIMAQLPILDRLVQGRETRADRMEQSKLKLAELALKRQEIQNSKDSREAERLDKTAQMRLDRMKNNAIGAGGMDAQQNRKRISGADNIFNTVGLPKDITEEQIDKIPSSVLNKNNRTMVNEVGLEVNNLLTNGGVPAASTLQKLLPDNFEMLKTRGFDFVFSTMSPAKQEAFLRNVLKVARRVRDTSVSKGLDYATQYFSGAKEVQERIPESYSDALQTVTGLTPEEIEEHKNKLKIRNSKNKNKESSEVPSWSAGDNSPQSTDKKPPWAK